MDFQAIVWLKTSIQRSFTMGVKQVVKDNEIAYRDSLYLEPPSLEELAQAEVVDPALDETIDVSVCGCNDPDDPDYRGGHDWLAPNANSMYPELLKVHPINYNVDHFNIFSRG